MFQKKKHHDDGYRLNPQTNTHEEWRLMFQHQKQKHKTCMYVDAIPDLEYTYLYSVICILYTGSSCEIVRFVQRLSIYVNAIYFMYLSTITFLCFSVSDLVWCSGVYELLPTICQLSRTISITGLSIRA